ncbi:serine hydrolase domain-containing protein [Stenotrophomonas rhizophila]|uniref:serine hydrolase domain-containing protein n=1 Tax=Stenotrophomonas rhizophila TaxID=216778 RepID=UPI0010C06A11|nr:serine hydrolase [Stenotrophomonas rhizophila]TKK09728.1 6-aminohexanoate hydrolase [Stenotrophomonas rhizophila]
MAIPTRLHFPRAQWRRAAACTLLGALALLPGAHAATASAAPPDAAASDPGALGWMQGFPPPEAKRIRYTDSDYFAFPKLRWTACHFRQLMPTVGVSRGPGAAAPLPQRLDTAIDALPFTPLNTRTRMTWAQSLQANYTDGIIVLHDGVVVYERYAGCLQPNGQHGAMSVTKSITGLLGEMLVAEGVLDENDTVGAIIPELARSAFGDATVRQVLEMTTALRYSEDYADPNAEVWQYAAAGSTLPPAPGYTGPRSYYDYLQTVQKQGRHGEAFGYKTINTDTLGWIIARRTGKPVSTLLSERIWTRLGAEQDAYYTVDSSGTPFAGGGFNAGLRDMARLGQLLLQDGRSNGEQVVPAAAIARIRAGGDKRAFANAGYPLLPGWSYRGMWWVSHNAHGAYMARGVHGQALYIDPAAKVVIARFGSHPVAGNSANDPTTLPAFDALARHLMAQPTR